MGGAYPFRVKRADTSPEGRILAPLSQRVDTAACRGCGTTVLMHVTTLHRIALTDGQRQLFRDEAWTDLGCPARRDLGSGRS
jgi:hypothetical protein